MINNNHRRNDNFQKKTGKLGVGARLSENKAFVWVCAGIVFLGLLGLKNNYVFSDQASKIISIIKPSPSPQKLQLEPAPTVVKGVYLTGWSAGNSKKIEEIINLAKTTEINAVVIDVKDYTGRVFFETQDDLIKNTGSQEIRIKDFAGLIKRLHNEKIYVIARIAVFQDLYLAEHKPEYAVKNSINGKIWRDNKNLAWVDPAAKFVWDYNIAVAKEAARLGADEINLDYIRFPSDGLISQLSYPVYDSSQKSKSEQIREFFEYFHGELKNSGAKTSADVFGLVTVNTDDMGIGQILEYTLPYFDYLSPMVYPSHYASGFIGYKNPALYPYEVVDYSLEKALAREKKLDLALNTGLSPASSSAMFSHIRTEKLPRDTKLAQLRPWLQVFNLGATYTPEMIRKQIQAVYDNNLDSGWYLWNPSNIYNSRALQTE